MEEQVTYTAVSFRTKSDVSTLEKPNELENIYEDVKPKEEAAAAKPENEKEAPVCSLLHLVAAGLVIICVALVSVIIILSIKLSRVTSEQITKNSHLTDRNEQLWTEKVDLQRQTRELSRANDRLNWTLGVILQYKNFPVETFCSKQECKPCRDGWVQFESHCYLFVKPEYSLYWKNWKDSHEECARLIADLVVIESQEEQKFINNHTNQKYRDEKHGYWIGLSKKDYTEMWTWVDRSNLTVQYWKKEKVSNRLNCALTSPYGEPTANWQKTSCAMTNRYICETRALIKQDEELAAS